MTRRTRTGRRRHARRTALDSIVTVLRAAGRPLRAAQIAERAGLERGTANRYLTYLCDTLIADREPEHGRPGHPAFLYTLASIWEPESREPEPPEPEPGP